MNNESGADIISRLCLSTMEPTREPDAILAELRAHDGQQLSKRNISRLNAALPGVDFRISKIAGMTSIEWGGWGRSSGKPGGLVLIAYADFERFTAYGEPLAVIKYDPERAIGLSDRNAAKPGDRLLACEADS